MRVLLVEDEPLAMERLEGLLRSYDPGLDVVAGLDSVGETVAWLRSHRPPDLAFFDIHLADGLCFEIFDQCEVPCPVIFTTAYDAYALQAFQVYSLDYLLKPVDLDDLRRAFSKLDRLRSMGWTNQSPVAFEQARFMMSQRYKSRFLVKSGDRLLTLPTEEIACFFSRHKNTWLVDILGKKYVVNYPLDQLESLLDPRYFFRISRQYIVAVHAIREMVDYTGNRLKLTLVQQPEAGHIVVSRERVPAFRDWLDS